MSITNITVCVVAHNEEEHLESCLSSIEAASLLVDDATITVHILNNGSRDNTQAVTEKYCVAKDDWFPIEIKLGDKANAWNYAMQNCVGENDLVVFVDGDCQISKESFVAFKQEAEAKGNAYVLAAIPLTEGRTSSTTIRNTLANSALSGNLYAITPTGNLKIKSLGFALPVGLIGDDSLLAWALTHDFKLSNGTVNGRLIGVENAKFTYHRLTPTSWKNIKLYYRRLTRYSLRHLQQKCIRAFLDKYDEFNELPNEVTELYHYLQPDFKRRDTLLNRFFDSKAYNEID